jgi:hypothetical protein
MHTNGVAIQVLTNKSKAAKRLNKVSKKLRQEVLNVQNQMMQQMVPTTYLLRTRLRTLSMPMEGYFIRTKRSALLVLVKRGRAFNQKRRWFIVDHCSLKAPRNLRSRLTRRKTMWRRRKRRLMRSNMRSKMLYRIRVTTGRRKPPTTTTLPI